jgi:hypothetical protein
MKKVFTIIAIGLLSGCSGTLYTIVNPDIPETGEKKIKGVIVHGTINVIELYKTTVLIDKSSGNQVGVAPNDCTPEKKMKFSTRADYSNPSIVVYEPGYLETNKFGVTLDKGVLSAVNTESNPSAALAGIATVLPFIKAPKTESSFLGVDGKPLCNVSPKLIGVYRAPDIQPFESIEQ